MTYEDFKIQFLQLMNELSIPTNQVVLDCLSSSSNAEGFGICLQGSLSDSEYIFCKLVMALTQCCMQEASSLESNFSGLIYDAAFFLSQHNLIDSTVIKECDAKKCSNFGNGCPYNKVLEKSAYRGIRFAYEKSPQKGYTYFVNPLLGKIGSADSRKLNATLKNQEVTVHENHDQGLLMQGNEWSLDSAGSWKCNLFVMDSLYLAMKTFFHINDANLNSLFIKQGLIRKKSAYYYNVDSLHTKFSRSMTFFRNIPLEEAGAGTLAFFFENNGNGFIAGHIEVLKDGFKLDKTTGRYTFQGLGAHCTTTNVRPSSIVESKPSKKINNSQIYKLDESHSYSYVAFYKVDASKLKRAIKGFI